MSPVLEPATAAPAPALVRGRRHDRVGWIAAAAAVVLAFALLGVLSEALAPGPGGPTSSSYATAPQGLAGWAELLARSGHPVAQLRQPLGVTRLDPGTTLVVLDPDALLPSEARRLRAFVEGGGRLLIGGATAPGHTLGALLADPPRWSAGGPSRFASAGEAPPAGVNELASAGDGSWVDTRGVRASVVAAGQALLVQTGAGQGEIDMLADASPLQNRLLAQADNAQLGLDLAGRPGRPVVFAESVHGFGVSRGLSALPSRWWVAFAGLALAGLIWVLARGRRLGPAEQPPVAAMPSRRAYVDAVSMLLRRADQPRELEGVVRAAAERELARRATIGAAASPSGRRDMLRRLGLSEAETAAVLGESEAPGGPKRLIVLGAALSRLRERG